MLIASSSGVLPEIRPKLDAMVKSLPRSAEEVQYSNLRLLEIYDSCLLKESFWSKVKYAAFEKQNPGMPLYYTKMIKNLDYTTVKNFFDRTVQNGNELDRGWCYDESGTWSASGGLSELPFAKRSKISIIDSMMTDDEFGLLVRVSLGVNKGQIDINDLIDDLKTREVPLRLVRLIDRADVITLANGNADLLAFVFRAFPEITRQLNEKLLAGKAILIGRTAGAMAMGAIATFSDDPTPEMLDDVLSGDGRGLNLLPQCIVKPNYNARRHETLAIGIEALSDLRVLRVPAGQAFVCMSGSCSIQGVASKPADLKFKLSDTAKRMYVVFKNLRGRDAGFQKDIG
eukprot:TRINITY_DN21219_c0_g1_i2.p1 TRINITY_DN21219_c0_g1~~TRINITY_DN21219_c0_g1_i2.p1  ORF type:complete len:343 (+),score=45.64 TRINITY_DN21219_c0_g1_i2:207-1235(+)